MIKRGLLLFIIFLFLNNYLFAFNIVNPKDLYKTIETPNFSIHYPKTLNETAKIIAKISESYHPLLTKEFKYTPKEKTQIVLLDSSDYTNGLSMVIPYNIIYLLITPPSLELTIGEFEDWITSLFIHEYIHIITMDTNRGYSETIRKIFGKPIPSENPFSLLAFLLTAPPNIFLPRWWHEGITTYGETEYSKRGRGRATFYETIIRMSVYEDKLPSIDKINDPNPFSPTASPPYIWGMRLFKEIKERYGKDAVADLSLRHGGRFPYFLNGAPLGIMGKDYIQLYNEALENTKKEQKEQITKLSQSPFTPISSLNIKGRSISVIKVSPDGKFIAMIKNDPADGEHLIILTYPDLKRKAYIRKNFSDKRIVWHPNSNKVYFTQAEIIDNINIYSDLYEYDITKEKVNRLSYSLRIKDIDISPEGKIFAGIINESGTNYLALIDDQFREEKIISFNDSYFFSPSFSPDGKSITFIRRDREGKNYLHLIDLKTKDIKTLIEDRFIIDYPFFSQEGDYIYFVSDKNGVFNLHRLYLKTGESKQVTHLLSGILHPSLKEDKIFFSELKGRELKASYINISSLKEDTYPSIKPYWKEEKDYEIKNIEPPLIEKPYSPLKTLLPSFFLPTLNVDYEGTVLGVFTANQDALGLHTYYTELSSGLKSNKIYYNLSCTNNLLYPTIKATLYKMPLLYQDFFNRGNFFEEETKLSLMVKIPLTYLKESYNLLLGTEFINKSAQSPLYNQTFKGIKIFEGDKNSYLIGFSFKNTLKYQKSIDYQEGRDITLLYSQLDNSLGSDIEGRRLKLFYKEYIPLKERSFTNDILYINLNVGLSDEERTAQDAYQLGGYPSLLTEFPLRGYSSRFSSGKHIFTLTTEYRTPIKMIYKGFDTKPLFLEKLYSSYFIDLGEVWGRDKTFKAETLKIGIGAELKLDVTLGYWAKVTPTIGIARGLTEDGEWQIYFTIYANF